MSGPQPAWARAFVAFTLRHGRLLWILAALIAIPATLRTANLYARLKTDIEELLPRVVLHEDHPTEGAQQPDQLVGVERHVPGDHRLFGLVERDARWDLE